MAWNEPGPGRDPWSPGPGGKPPDFAQLLRRLRSRLGGGASASVAAAALALAFTVWVLSGFFSVDEKDRGMVLRFGAFERIVEPGLHWRLPWPAGRVVNVDVTQVRQARERTTVLSRDDNLAEVEVNVQYRVGSPRDFLLSLSDPEDALQNFIRSTLRQLAGNMNVDTLLGDGRNTLGPKLQENLQQQLDSWHAGLQITEVGVQQVQPPDAVQAAFADAIKAREDQQRLREEAKAYADSRLPNARGEAAQKIAEATSYRDQSIARAQGDVARFEAVLEQYRKAPKVTRERLYLDAMSEIYASTTKVLIDSDKSNPVIYLPLEQLLKNAQAASAEGAKEAGGGASAQTPRPLPGLPGSGDANRSRDRGSR